LIAALFRLVEPSGGQVHIDGLNTSEMGLKDVRSAISFIPQNPVIFSGTIRKNLDPFEILDDTEMWNALVKVQLAERMMAEGGASGLDSTVNIISLSTRSLFDLGTNTLLYEFILCRRSASVG